MAVLHIMTNPWVWTYWYPLVHVDEFLFNKFKTGRVEMGSYTKVHFLPRIPGRMNFNRGTKHFEEYSIGARNILEIAIWGYKTFSIFYNEKMRIIFQKKYCVWNIFHDFVNCQTFFTPSPNFLIHKYSDLNHLRTKNGKIERFL